ncbi:MAG: hypothetical protein K6B74_11415, partial [Ruminococcus sp.]|nr:hypothetical protein [Ruminococcus sp.]
IVVHTAAVQHNVPAVKKEAIIRHDLYFAETERRHTIVYNISMIIVFYFTRKTNKAIIELR